MAAVISHPFSCRGDLYQSVVNSAFRKVGAPSNRCRNVAFSLESISQWVGSPDLTMGRYIEPSCSGYQSQAEGRIAMAAQVTRKKKRQKKPVDRVQLVEKRFMEIDVDPGRDAELGWIDNAEDAKVERTVELKGNRIGTASSKRREH
jgi:hypothetical protein